MHDPSSLTSHLAWSRSTRHWGVRGKRIIKLMITLHPGGITVYLSQAEINTCSTSCTQQDITPTDTQVPGNTDGETGALLTVWSHQLHHAYHLMAFEVYIHDSIPCCPPYDSTHKTHNKWHRWSIYMYCRLNGTWVHKWRKPHIITHVTNTAAWENAVVEHCKH